MSIRSILTGWGTVVGLMGGALLPGAAQVSGPPTTIVLVRHAEKAAAPAEDPPLTVQGVDRAHTLAHVLGAAGVSTIYATQFTRTRATAEPLAHRLELEITVVEATSSHVGDMVERLRGHPAGAVVVVVGHSNTVPAIIDALGAGPAPAIHDQQYDGLFVVTLFPDGSAALLPLRYGRPTP